ncbi:MAG: xanthine dehydrogenase accessory protein XdhC [Gammaproteobacteria bacterium]|nr:xanthine dehydrogenase accessory protein XdhC [Gammaproteobacteria bacterium]
MRWPQLLCELADRGDPFVIVTVAATRGSTPRETGAKMFVTATRTLGTIGGGQVEYECTALACQWLRELTPARTYTRSFTLGADCGQCCGGVAEILFEQIIPAETEWLNSLPAIVEQDLPAIMVTVGDTRTGVEKSLITGPAGADDSIGQIAAGLLASNAPACRSTVAMPGNLRIPALFEPMQPSCFEIVLFGAGHVGSAMVSNLAPLNCNVLWIDSRAEAFPAQLPANTKTINDVDPQTVIDKIPGGRYFLIMTHSHALDLEICARVLARDDFSYCGLIGSRSKRRQFTKRLRALGLSDQQIDRLVCPIGIDGITGKRPAEIAVAVSAQLLRLREAGLAAREMQVSPLRQVQR